MFETCETRSVMLCDLKAALTNFQKKCFTEEVRDRKTWLFVYIKNW